MKKIIKKEKQKIQKISLNNQFVFLLVNRNEQEKMLLSNLGLINYANMKYNELDLNEQEKFKKLINKNGLFDNWYNAKNFLEDNIFNIQIRIRNHLDIFINNFVYKGQPIFFSNYNKETIEIKNIK